MNFHGNLKVRKLVQENFGDGNVFGAESYVLFWAVLSDQRKLVDVYCRKLQHTKVLIYEEQEEIRSRAEEMSVIFFGFRRRERYVLERVYSRDRPINGANSWEMTKYTLASYFMKSERNRKEKPCFRYMTVRQATEKRIHRV